MKVKLLFIFALLLTAVTGAWADDSGSCGTVSYSYVESTHTLTISGTGAMADYPDPSERPWDSYAEEIETVIIEDGVTGIGINAFGYCASLTTVTIGSGVTYIGSDAFYDCPKAEVVYCNANPATLAWDESGCDDFKEDGTTIIHVADAAPWIAKFGDEVHGIFSDKPYVPFTWNYDAGTKTLTFSGTASIPSYNDLDERPWKDYVEVVENIVIEDGVTSIGVNAFGYCASLTTVTIPASVTGIGMFAFYDCTGLTTITIPASVTSIGRYAFYHCESLTSVIVHASNCTLGEDAFDECYKLEAIYVPSDKVEYYKAAENWSAYADKITAFIGGDCGAEGHEKDVTWVLKGTSLTISGTGAMADYASSENQPWKDYRSSITSVIIESGVTSIGKNAFNNCTGLTSATVDAPDCTLGNGAFEGCNLKAIYVPSDLVDHYKTAWSAYASIIMENIISQGYCGAEGHEEDVTWVLKGTSHNYTLTISGTGAMADYDNPFERPWDSYANGIETIVIEDGVTSIGSSAFCLCTGLTTVTIPAGVTSIGADAFFNCSGLTAVTIPASVTTIGDEAFRGCSSLTTVTFATGSKLETIDDAAFASTGLTSIEIPASVTTIDDFAFQECSDLATVTFASGAKLETIGIEVFGSCKSLNSVTIPASVTSIGTNAFISCTGLTTVTFDSGSKLETIGEAAFDGTGLTSINIPASVTTIGNGAFTGCSQLVTMTVDAGNTKYDSRNGCNAIIEKKSNTLIAGCNSSFIPDDVTAIGDGAFFYCTGLTTVTIPASVTSIGDVAFAGCDGLTTVTIPAGVTYIGKDAFYDCTAVTDVYCNADPEKLTWNEDYCDDFKKDGSTIIHVADADPWYTKFGGEVHGIFRDPSTVPFSWNYDAGTKTLTFSGTEAIPSYNTPDERPWIDYVSEVENIVIEDGVRSIGEFAFYDCYGLTTVTIPASVTSIGKFAFNYCSGLTTITIPASVTSIGYAAFAGCSNLATMTVDAGNTKYDSRNGCNAIIEKESNTLIAGCKNTIIPDDVTNIDINAFEGCISLTTVTIPAGVTRIGDHAFSGCSGLTTVTIPAGVTSIGVDAFSGCSGLTTVTIGSGVTYIGYDAFFNCTAVTDVYCYANPKELTWDDGSCDDFMEEKATKCHVTDATKFEEKWSTGDSEVDVNVTFVGDLAPEAETKAAGEEYWSSYYNSATHLKADDNTTVYKATLSGTTVTLTEINDKVITAGQAVLLKKTTTDAVELTPCADASADDYSGNDLEGVDAKTAKESGSDYYVLSYNGSKLSFYKYSGTTLGANKAFFKIPANSSREFLDILGEVTGIDGLNGELKNGKIEELKFYDLNGRRVLNPTKGIYIVNGKKVVLK